MGVVSGPDGCGDHGGRWLGQYAGVQGVQVQLVAALDVH